ncbi:hypothetical protein [Streptomyces sp. NPDC053720]|uniref:hypothetical protein n=1 Tax=Streptomyces sp. NPDC053720 TaxID=3154855 RepID=UPI0034125D1F
MVGHRLRQALVVHTGSVWAVAAGVVDGRPVAVTGSSDQTARVWGLTTGQQIGAGSGRSRPSDDQSDKSRMTGDCHVRILWEPEGEIPSGYPTTTDR